MNTQIKTAATALKNGDVVAIPTETVYGLAASAFDENAVRKIFEIKKRPLFNPLIIHIKSIDDLHHVAKDIPPIALQLANHFWPGPLTLVLPKKENIPDIVTAGKATVGIRVPAHPITLALLNEIDFPLAAPSANPFGYISPTKSEHVKKQLGDAISIIIEGGQCEKGIESTIIGFENNKPVIYRVGAIPQEAIEAITGKIGLKNKALTTPESPGMLSKHYSPKTRFKVSSTISKCILENCDLNVGFLLFTEPNTSIARNKYVLISGSKNMDEAAKNLYAAMHELDAKNFDLIIAEQLPDSGIGLSLNDRLLRAQETTFEFDYKTPNTKQHEF
jgi:L-threonylcarbamoyladenylate synthase